jgi:hypothetical protein
MKLLTVCTPSSRTIAPVAYAKARLASKAASLTANYEPIIWTMWDSGHLTSL